MECCFPGNHKLVSHRVCETDVLPPDSAPKLNKKVAKCEFPELLSTNQLTTVYKVPNKEYSSEKSVVSRNGFELGAELGNGAFATVVVAHHIKSGTKIACKRMFIGDGSKKSLVVDMKNELFVMEKVNHPFIVRLYRHFIINEYLFIFMQMANGGTLSKFVNDYGPLSEKESKIPFAQILSGVAHMHKLNIAHRDLKLSNILLLKNDDNQYNVLLTDFGLSRVAYSNKDGVIMKKTYCGTPVYMAPEISGNTKYNPFLVDVWALGVIAFVMINLDYPFESFSRIKPKNDKYGNFPWRFSSYVKDPSKELIDFLDRTFESNPRKRISLRKMIKHEWIARVYNKTRKLVLKFSSQTD